MVQDNVCENCKYWLQTGAADSGLLGECHRNPPSPVLSEAAADANIRFTIWPTTLQTQWCGAFEAKPMDQGEVLERMAMIEKLEAERKSRKK